MDGLYRRKCWVKVLRTVTYAALVAAAPEDVVDMCLGERGPRSTHSSLLTVPQPRIPASSGPARALMPLRVPTPWGRVVGREGAER